MHIHYLSTDNSLLHQFLNEIRDNKTQTDRMRFRRNIERIGEIMAYEISKTLDYQSTEVETPLAAKKTMQLAHNQVICSILRAGLPLHTGFLNYFDHAENGFISAYRRHSGEETHFDIVVEYQAIADIDDKVLFLVDPMLATGQSIVAVYNQLLQRGKPKEIHIAVVIASPEGIRYVENQLPESIHLWVAALDDKLNTSQYIVPGLGDAGDLAFGQKL